MQKKPLTSSRTFTMAKITISSKHVYFLFLNVSTVILMLGLLFSVSLLVFCVPYVGYLAYVKHYANKPWRLKIDESFQPFVSILVPAHNEEYTIDKKLENLATVAYPKEKIEIIVVDDASEDGTVMKVENFIEAHPELNIKVVKQDPRAGKSAALNNALTVSTHSIVIVSDADTSWSSDILTKALPYLADPTVGAITGRGINENTKSSWVTNAEDTYLNLTCLIRTAESKIHSTIRFEGGFCAYKKGTFTEFDRETGSDDSGTALDVVQHNKRAILVPSVVFSTSFPTVLSGKIKIKARRANQLIGLWIKCFKLLLKGKLVLPKKIAIPEIILFIVNPLIFLLITIIAVTSVIISPFSMFSLSLLLLVGLLLLFARNLFLELLLDNFLLVHAFLSYLFGKRYIAWKKTKY